MAKEEHEDQSAIAWYNIPFYRSLTEQILFMGAPRMAIMLNATIAFLFVVNFHFWYIIPLSICLHFLCIYISKFDDQFFDCLKVYQMKKNYYDA